MNEIARYIKSIEGRKPSRGKIIKEAVNMLYNDIMKTKERKIETTKEYDVIFSGTPKEIIFTAEVPWGL